ncbi:hypothetical protein [uncultured Nocardioides sp.]|jgi:hypothetical protein|uniref:hypothetical protein n=1 Tax=uncultured Nocardioides sp. TaxID=198441 RepID=UPI0026223EA0|nr:hypothetical protein [uncultured Nocardioides sp.]HRD59349.1 hypothetical protein [Nocardioides sp.]
MIRKADIEAADRGLKAAMAAAVRHVKAEELADAVAVLIAAGTTADLLLVDR